MSASIPSNKLFELLQSQARLSTTSDTALPPESPSGTPGSTELSVRTRSIRFGQLVMSALNVAKRVEGETIEIEVTCSDLNQHRRREETRVTIFRA